MEIISRDECLQLLGAQKFGRLGFVVDGQPLILPVNYALHADVVLFRTGEGTKLEAATNARVAFEVDEVDVDAGTGWSILLQGVAQEITDDVDYFAEVLRRAAAPTWVPGPTDHYVRIVPHHISGRRLPSPSREARDAR
jgi:nitroimidazol reductase NimA-like FMN-containing flavoprotein (pyridoxamine 5'-phosphate oxidase superfamily)